MVERAIELRRRHARKKKMKKLKAALGAGAAAPGPDREGPLQNQATQPILDDCLVDADH